MSISQILKECRAVRNHLQEAAAGIMVFAEQLEVAGQRIYPFGQNRNLDIGRTGVLLVNLMLLDYLGFDF